MVLNLSWQWETDSIATRCFAMLLAPFITNSEFWAATLKNAEIETLHALTYSEIVRQCIPDVKVIFKSIMNNEQITGRSPELIAILEDLQRAGCEYTLGIVENDQQLFDRVYLGMIAMYLLERIQFMSSFASTFAIGEQGYMLGICKDVQKIAIDELTCHAEVLKYALSWMLENDARAKETMKRHEDRILSLYKEVLNREYNWSKYLFSEGRKMVGLNPTVLNEWVDYNAYFAYRTLKLVPENTNLRNPLKFMKDWLDIDSTQNAQQESSGNNYLLQTLSDDLNDNEILEF